MRANFIKMISPIRFRESSVKKDPTDGRNPFDSDYHYCPLKMDGVKN